MARRPEQIDAIVVIFDVGKTCLQPTEAGTTYFEKSRECISWILRRKIMSMSKDLLCLILTGTDEEGEPLDELDVSLCQNISIKYDFQYTSWDMLYFIDNKVKMSNKTSDWLGALAVSLEKLKVLSQSYIVVNKTVVIFSELNFTISTAISQVLEKVIDLKPDIVIINSDNSISSVFGQDCGADMDQEPCTKKIRIDKEVTDLEEEEVVGKEIILELLLKKLGGLLNICSFDSFLRQLSSYSKRNVRATPWNAILDIGDLKISVQLFKKIDKKLSFQASYKSLKREESHNSTKTKSHELRLADVVKDNVMYYKHVVSNTLEIKEISVEKDDIISGYRYGASLIPYSDEDKSIMGYKPGRKCFSVLGFTSIDKIQYYLLTGEGAYIVVPDVKDKEAVVALSAVIQAMHETRKVAIVRRVYSDDRGLSFGVLYPVMRETLPESLVFIELAYEEDVRTVHFPRLRGVKKVITSAQFQFIDSLIRDMDLMNVKSDTGEHYEVLDLKSRHEVKSQFFQHCIVQKALYPNEPLPKDLPEHCRKYVMQMSVPAVKMEHIDKKLKELFPLKTLSKSNVSSDEYKDDNHGNKFEDNEFRTAEDCFRNLFTLHRYPPVEAIQKLLDLSVHKFGHKEQDVVRALLKLTREARDKTIETFTDNYNFWLRRLRINLGMEGELEQEYWKGILEGNLGIITLEEHKDSYATIEDAEFFYDSLKQQSVKIDNEEKMDEIEEAVNLLF